MLFHRLCCLLTYLLRWRRETHHSLLVVHLEVILPFHTRWVTFNIEP
jgi:hypothetical protein